jgi:hypothetical protein
LFSLCRPTQQPDGTLSPAAIPAPQAIREMQPDAKFIITLADPVQRLYSDYYFLEDDRSVANRGGKASTKSAVAFHLRVEEQIEQMKKCVQDEVVKLTASASLDAEEARKAGQEGSPQWFRASQM